MDYDHAKRIGDEGERIVSNILQGLARRHELQVLDDLLLEVAPGITSQIDHVVIDRFGVLIIESKVRNHALIRGRDVDSTWTACYRSGRKATFQNPLEQNRRHESAIRQVLERAGKHLPPDFVKSAVVIVGANLSQLEMDAHSSARVTDERGLEPLITQRHASAVNDGTLSQSDVAAYAALLRSLDRSGDARVHEQHAEYRGGRAAPSGPQASAYRPDPPGWGPSPTQAWAHRERVAPAYSSSAQAQTSWPPASVRRVSSPGFDSPPSFSRPHVGLSYRLRAALRELLAKVAVFALVAGVWWWLFMGGGFMRVLDFGSPSSTATAEPVAESPAPAAPTIEQAKAAMRAADPELFAKFATPDYPSVRQVPQGTTFTWDYLETSGSKATVHTVALTLDANGQVVGVDMQ